LHGHKTALVAVVHVDSPCGCRCMQIIP